MKQNDYHLQLLNSFDTSKYDAGKKASKAIKHASHTEIKKILENNRLTNNCDYIRSCSTCDFTDLSAGTVKENLNINSKYIVIKRLKKDAPPIYLCHNNLKKIYHELEERYLDRGFFHKGKRLKAHFISENRLRFGTKKSGYYCVDFKKADINSIVKKHIYDFNKEHLELQAQLAALGKFFGYESKLARQEKNQLINGINLNKMSTLLSVPDLEINSLRVDEEEIDFIDVIWFDRKENIIVAAFEVELSSDPRLELGRFTTLKLSCKEYGSKINLVILAEEDRLNRIRKQVQKTRYRRDFQESNLKFLPLQNFIDILHKRDKLLNSNKLKREFFNQTMIDISPKPIIH